MEKRGMEPTARSSASLIGAIFFFSERA